MRFATIIIISALCGLAISHGRGRTKRSVSDIVTQAAAVAQAVLERVNAKENELAKVQKPAVAKIDRVQHAVMTDSRARPFGDSAIVSTCIAKDVSNQTGKGVADTLKVCGTTHLPSCPYKKQECDKSAKYRSADGSCNNLKNSLLGSAFTPFKRFIPSEYGDGLSTLRESNCGKALPNARVVSNVIITEGVRPHRFLTCMVMHFGQFLDHDVTLTEETMLHADGKDQLVSCGDDGCDADFHASCHPIPYPDGDPIKEHKDCIKFVRSLLVANVDCTIGPVEQLNAITAFVDASNVYGSCAKETEELRDTDTTRGKLKTFTHNGEALMPKTDHPTCVDSGTTTSCFLAGDLRANEQNGLTSIHTLFVREHNRIEAELHRLNMGWDGEKLFQESRKILIAEMQHVVYSEFLPIVLGSDGVQTHGIELLKEGFKTDYDEDVDPTIRNSFATAAYRFGHSLIPDFLERAGSCSGSSSRFENLILSNIYFKTEAIYESSLDAFYRGIAGQRAPLFDTAFTKQVTDHLFSEDPPKGAGEDLVARNVQRGRDHGIPGYIKFREFCDLETSDHILKLKDITRRKRKNLAKVYSHVNDIDLFMGGVSESRVKGAVVGPTFACLIGKQFQALRDGDRFFYENEGVFTAEQLTEIRKTSLSKIICNNGRAIGSIQPNIFLRAVNSGGINNKQKACCNLPDMDLSKWRE